MMATDKDHNPEVRNGVRRIWQFSNRDILWCTVVIAAFAAWFSEHRRGIRIGRDATEVYQENMRLRSQLDERSKRGRAPRPGEEAGEAMQEAATSLNRDSK